MLRSIVRNPIGTIYAYYIYIYAMNISVLFFWFLYNSLVHSDGFRLQYFSYLLWIFSILIMDKIQIQNNNNHNNKTDDYNDDNHNNSILIQHYDHYNIIYIITLLSCLLTLSLLFYINILNMVKANVHAMSSDCRHTNQMNDKMKESLEK